MSENVTVEYLDDERKKLWERISVLESLHTKIDSLVIEVGNKSSKDELSKLATEFDQKLPDHEREAKNASKMIAEYKNKCKSRAEEVEAASHTIADYQGNLAEIASQYKTLLASQKEANKLLEQIHRVHDTVAEQANDANGSLQVLRNNQATAHELLQAIEESCEAWRDAERSVLSTVKPKMEALLENADKDAREIRKVYETVLGSAGLKDKFEKALESFQRNFLSQQRDVKAALVKTREELESLGNDSTERYNKLLEDKESTYTRLKNQIESLLPNALTAGLSSAYQEKRTNEVTERDSAQKTFVWSIVAMSILALLPVIFNGWLLFYHNNPVEDLVANFPFTVILILPLYAPVLWLAYAANKRINQSKRLIEEYSHKEALSKTFEGLSTQVKQLQDTGHSGELSVKLLYNIIKASSENPGELIKGFNKPDNPILDVLDKTVACTESLNKLAEIPGFKTIANRLCQASARKVSRAKNEVNDVVARGLSTQEDEDT